MKSLVTAIGVFLLGWLIYDWYKQGAFSSSSSSTPSGSDTQSPANRGSAFDNITQAIYQFEDPSQNQVATRNNNPGNLKPPNGNPSFWDGQTGVDSGGFATFGDIGDGWDALTHDLTVKLNNNPSWDFYDLFSYYLTGRTDGVPVTSQGDSNSYAEYVAGYAGYSPTTPVSQVVAAGG